MSDLDGHHSSDVKTMMFKIYESEPIQFTIVYKDKDDLYEKFMRKINALNTPVGQLYFTDIGSDHMPIENADDLYTATLKRDTRIKLYGTVADVDVAKNAVSDDVEASKKHRHRHRHGKHHNHHPHNPPYESSELVYCSRWFPFYNPSYHDHFLPTCYHSCCHYAH